jgi:hypothetical protein
MVESVRDTAKNEVDICLYIDNDDILSVPVAEELHLSYKVGPRIRKITQAWNEVLDIAKGEIYQQGNDDVLYVTPGWDVMVQEAYDEVPDKIMVAHGNDRWGHGSNFGPHGFAHKRFVDCIGYFIAPHYSSDFGDAHLMELANMLGRRRFLPFTIEHLHFSQGMAEIDENTRERLQRHTEDDPETLYYSPEMANERQRDANKLAALMQRGVDTSKWVPPHNNIRSAGMCPHCDSLSTVAIGVGKFHCNHCGSIWDRI